MSNNHLIDSELNSKRNIFFELVASKKWKSLFELIELEVFDINLRDQKGRNALFWAIHHDNIEIIEKLISQGIDTKNVIVNLSAINYTVYRDNVKILKTLKKCGLDLDEKDSINSTPLIYAILYNKLNSINYLVDNNVNLQHEDFLGNSPISLAYDLKITHLINKFSKHIKNRT